MFSQASLQQVFSQLPDALSYFLLAVLILAFLLLILKRTGNRHKFVIQRKRITSPLHDGLIIAKVKYKRRSARFPFRILLLAIIAFWIFKGAMLSFLGPTTYQLRIDKLANGTSFERFGALFMADDALTRFIAKQIPTGKNSK
ncbi:hypothetical protein [Profundibacter sp.]|uniref:hypothetical protein n=1 Tax=Profundibacter sp. TaxID=3101071 RepID=UPI003D0B1337